MNYLSKRVLTRTGRGATVDPVTRQGVQFMPHTGDIAYKRTGDDAVANVSEIKTFNRQQLLNISTNDNLNDIGENEKIIDRVNRGRVIKI